MKYFLLCFGFFLGIQSAFPQKLNFGVCNEFENVALRDKCLKSSLDNLFVKKLLQLRLEMKDASNSQIDVSFDVDVSRVGLFTLRNFESNNPSIYAPFNQILIDIVPLSSYKQNNRLVQSTLKFDYSLRFLENSNIEIIQSGKRIFTSNIQVQKEDPVQKGKPIEKFDLTDNSKSDTQDDLPFAIIENVPVFPGCEPLQTNLELKDCMSGNISSFVVSNFDTDIASNLKLPDGRVRISMQFKINTFGYVVDITARAPHPELEKEAIRVINALPKFEPGKQKGRTVNVLYSLPILFQVESDD
jgi:hypothetical protein